MTPNNVDRLAALTSCAVLLSAGLALTEGSYRMVLASAVAFAGLCVVALLAHAWQRSTELEQYTTASNVRLIRAHVVAHAIPLGFALEQLAGQVPVIPQIAWIGGFMLFFYSGRRTWLALEHAFKRPLYMIFRRGNSAMLITMTCVALLAEWLESDPLAAFLRRVLSIYLIIHLALTGLAVARIDRDLGR